MSGTSFPCVVSIKQHVKLKLSKAVYQQINITTFFYLIKKYNDLI
jgi:hypothetical protein